MLCGAMLRYFVILFCLIISFFVNAKTPIKNLSIPESVVFAKSVYCDNGKIAFLDKGDNSLKVFDINLKHIEYRLKIKEGQGPGEVSPYFFMANPSIAFSQKKVFINDIARRSILVFNSNGIFLKQLKQKQPVIYLNKSSEKLYLFIRENSGDGFSLSVKVMDTKTYNILKSIKLNCHFKIKIIKQYKLWSDPVIALNKKDKSIAVFNGENSILFFNSKGELQKTLKLPVKSHKEVKMMNHSLYVDIVSFISSLIYWQNQLYGVYVFKDKNSQYFSKIFKITNEKFEFENQLSGSYVICGINNNSILLFDEQNQSLVRMF